MARLAQMVKQGLVKGFKSSDVKPFFCDACVQGKIKTASFPKQSMSRATVPFERICMDICGPLKKPTVQGNSYYLLTTDDYTGWTSVTTFKNRQQFLPVIQQHYAALPCKLPRAIRMDSDGVFVSHAFKQWLGENNIRPEYCQPRRHQQNGAAEASIRSINDMARCMLVASGLPGKYWGYAVQHAVFVRNRVVSSNLDASPYFKAFSKQPDLNMLQEFGSEVYALNDDARKFKLGDKTVKGRFLGYSVDTGSPSALVLLKSGKVLRSRDVVFSPTPAQLAQWETTEADPVDWLSAGHQPGSVGAAAGYNRNSNPNSAPPQWSCMHLMMKTLGCLQCQIYTQMCCLMLGQLLLWELLTVTLVVLALLLHLWILRIVLWICLILLWLLTFSKLSIITTLQQVGLHTSWYLQPMAALSCF